MSRLAKFDRVVVGEATINYLGPAPGLSAKAAFVSTADGATYGWTNNTQWSKDTLKALAALRSSMEEDLEAIHFDGGTSREASSTPKTPDKFEGLGEHLHGEADVPSV